MKECNKCLYNSNIDPDLTINQEGLCNHCLDYTINVEKFYFGNDPKLSKFFDLIDTAKREGKNSKYDAIVGLSGGVDSTYVAYLCKIHNLRVLAIHLDNGWNSGISVVNIKNILKSTGFDLYTYVINWNEFRDLQKSYFKANVVDIEALTDYAISSILRKKAKEHNVKFVFSGSSITTEGRLPAHWVHFKGDTLNIKAIHKKFGTIPIKTFPIDSVLSSFFRKDKHVKFVDILDYYPYNKQEAKVLIKKEFQWIDYGGKHYESVFTRFYQAYILPRKFNIDKRYSHYSTLICANQLTKEEALKLMQLPIYEDAHLMKMDLEFVIKKLGFTNEEFEKYIQSPRIEHTYYHSLLNYIQVLVKIKRFFFSLSIKLPKEK